MSLEDRVNEKLQQLGTALENMQVGKKQILPIDWEPPQLAIDTRMKTEYNKDVHPRGRVERRVVWNLLKHLAHHGFMPTIVQSDEDVKTDTAMKVMEEVFNLDDCYIFFRKGKVERWVRIILGNDGWDCISDWGYAKGDPDGFNSVIDAFDGERYC